MNNVRTLNDMWNNIRQSNDIARITIDTVDAVMKIINKIKERRELLNISQRELAQKCGLKQPAIARIESFKIMPQINTLIKIAKVLKINIIAIDEISESNIISSTTKSFANLNTYQQTNYFVNSGDVYYAINN